MADLGGVISDISIRQKLPFDVVKPKGYADDLKQHPNGMVGSLDLVDTPSCHPRNSGGMVLDLFIWTPLLGVSLTLEDRTRGQNQRTEPDV